MLEEKFRDLCEEVSNFVKESKDVVNEVEMLSFKDAAKKTVRLLRRGQKRNLYKMTRLQMMVDKSHLSVREKHTFESLLGHILYRTLWPIKEVLRIQKYLQNEHYALWEVIEFGDSYKALSEETCKGPTSESSAKKKGKTFVITTEDMQKRRNDVKARTTLLLALPDKHQMRFSKYETAKELWEAILKTFGGNEATKKTKKNQLKLQYGNFKAEGSETLEETFNRLQAIVLTNQKWNVSIATKWAILLESADHLEVNIADDEVPTEFALMVKSSSSSENKVVFDVGSPVLMKFFLFVTLPMLMLLVIVVVTKNYPTLGVDRVNSVVFDVGSPVLMKVFLFVTLSMLMSLVIVVITKNYLTLGVDRVNS
nr:ribonuclease H-like domain-containing protein [Tanacetum cinerariifolium]